MTGEERAYRLLIDRLRQIQDQVSRVQDDIGRIGGKLEESAKIRAGLAERIVALETWQKAAQSYNGRAMLGREWFVRNAIAVGSLIVAGAAVVVAILR